MLPLHSRFTKNGFEESFAEFLCKPSEENLFYSEAPPKIAIFSKKKAEIAQLVEHDLAKVGVASSSLVFRS